MNFNSEKSLKEIKKAELKCCKCKRTATAMLSTKPFCSKCFAEEKLKQKEKRNNENNK